MPWFGLNTQRPAAEAASRAFMKEETAVEVIVPSRIKPLALEPIRDRVRASRRAIVVEEGPRTGGWGAEVASALHEELHGELAAPVHRIGAADEPLPAATHLEAELLPSSEGIERAVMKMIEAWP